ncbi:hypothetical protein DFH09DRAFT_1074076 [Mycena vulgaris]|nr:hypothetical protein DFH09DRAFT_1074076 [Mycena vulgaris]
MSWCSPLLFTASFLKPLQALIWLPASSPMHQGDLPCSPTCPHPRSDSVRATQIILQPAVDVGRGISSIRQVVSKALTGTALESLSSQLMSIFLWITISPCYCPSCECYLCCYLPSLRITPVTALQTDVIPAIILLPSTKMQSMKRWRTDTKLTFQQPHPSFLEEEENLHRLKHRRLENQHSAVTQFLDLEVTEDRDESDPDEEGSIDEDLDCPAFINDDGLSHHLEGEESTDLKNPALEFMDKAEELAAITKTMQMISAWGDKNTNSGQNVPEALQSLEQHLTEQAPQLAPPRICHGPRGALTLVNAAPILPRMWGGLRQSLKQGPKKGSLVFTDSDSTFLMVADVKMEGDNDDTKSSNTKSARKDAKSMGKWLPVMSGPGLALAEGSQVVVKPLDGELLVFGDSGYITEIHRVTVTVHRSYCGKHIIQLQREFFTQLTGNASDDNIQINIESLRRHILDISCTLQLGDCMEVVSPMSEWMGKQAQVMQIELHPGLAFVDLVEAESASTFQVDMADLKRVFAIRDLVKAGDRHHKVGSTMDLQTTQSSVLAAHLEFALEESGPGAEGGDVTNLVLHGEQDIIWKQMLTGRGCDTRL